MYFGSLVSIRIKKAHCAMFLIGYIQIGWKVKLVGRVVLDQLEKMEAHHYWTFNYCGHCKLLQNLKQNWECLLLQTNIKRKLCSFSKQFNAITGMRIKSF